MNLRPFFACLLGLTVAAGAHADRRIFAFTYPYMTLPQGGLEIEHYLDADLALRDDPATEASEALVAPDWKTQVELEYGITDRWDLGFYQVFRQKPFGGFAYRGVKLRTRYRFAEEGDLPVDTAVYVEGFYKGDEAGVEERLILSKRLDAIEIVLNLKGEQEWKFGAAGTDLELAFVPSLGAGYHINESLALGAEYLGKLVWEDALLEQRHFAGPTLSYSNGRFWWTLGVLPQITTAPQPSFMVRSLLSVAL